MKRGNEFEAAKTKHFKPINDKRNICCEDFETNERSEDDTLMPLSRDLSKFFDKNPFLIEDVNDFWSFVNKYELVEKKKGVTRPPCLEKGIDRDIEDFPKEHDPAYCVNITLNIPVKDIVNVISHKVKNAANGYAEKFKFLVSLYIDFKQKEKFTILKKIRDTQRSLPVTLYRDEIIHAVSNERVIIIAGDTGCGKSTQIPQYLIQAGYNRVACTQPRRIACVSLSKRVARETLSEYTSQVGFQIRFEKNINSDTKILFVTEGLLLRQMSDNKLLSEYDVIILDEVHERHLHGDFLLGIMKCLLYQRDDFKLILMSATINIELFENYFGSFAKTIQVPGRLYPIKTQYHPISKVDKLDSNKDFDPAPYIRILNLIDHKYPKDERGDVLMFLSGVKEITAVVEAARLYNEKIQCWCILPLYSSLSLEEQNKVFDYPPEGYRKCVVATNIAETSITIDGVRFVVDSGKVNEVSYDPVCRLQRLKEFWISRASAEQRKGRAGRTGPGVCFRLYSEEEYAALSQYTLPEIQRVPLDSILLQMIALGLPDARKFPFIEPPTTSSIENSITNLKLYNALTNDEQLTELGKTLSKLPVDICLGKMLITGTLFHQVESVLSLAATLSVQSPFTYKAHRDLEMQDLRKEMESDHGDPITLLNIFREWLKLKNNSGGERGHYPSSKRWCKKRGLEEQRFYEMIKLRSQFKDLLVTECKLINEDLTVIRSEEEMTRHERIIRRGELSQLRKMKKALTRENDGNKRKILKSDDSWEIEPSEFEEEQGMSTDIRDVEFRMKNNPFQVQRLLKNSTATTYKDLSMLKVILCSSIYPHLAIPDEFNSSRTVKEQLFHTAGKSHIALHPNCYFSFNPEIIQLSNNDIIDCPPGFESKLPVSSKHQVLFYMSLLETTKTYLVNVLRIPAAQSLLLFCNSLHANSDFTRIVCDRWIDLTFTSSSAAEILILKVTKIRSLWNKLSVLQLQGKPCNNLNEVIASKVIEFLSSEIYYTIKRLLSADVKTLFSSSETVFDIDDTECCNPFDPNFKIHPNEEIGGLQITDYMTYNCLSNDNIQTEMWECDKCGLMAPFSSLEKLQHKYRHDVSDNVPSDFVDDVKFRNYSPLQPRKSNAKLYRCDICNKDFYFTPTEILKHKGEHQSTS